MGKYRYLFNILFICLIFNSDFGNKNNIDGRDHVSPVLADDCPVINAQASIIKNADCGQSDGSITGITATNSSGKMFYTWRNSAGKVVGNSIDLINIPTDVYTLEVTDGGICGKAFSSPLPVGENNSVTIDAASVITKPSSCNTDGSVTGIIVTGATQIQWIIFGTTTVVGTSADLTNVPPGSYILNASNSYCSKSSGPYVVASSTILPVIQKVAIANSTCNAQNGSIDITLLVSNSQPKLSFYWEDADFNVIANGVILAGELNPVLTLNGIDSGDYYLYVQGSDNCMMLLGKYNLLSSNILIILDSAYYIPDRCNKHVGYLQVSIQGGTPGRGNEYLWTDSAGNVVSTFKYAGGLGAGKYTLFYQDVGGLQCTATATFTVTDSSPPVAAPSADGSTLCLPGVATIAAKNADTAGSYNLYAMEADTIPLATNKTGLFYQKVKETTNFYLAKTNGSCESPRTKVTIIVVADIDIPNAFTPNNDGINDYWNIKNIEKFPGAIIDIFNRQGQLVFYSVNYSKPFNGLYNGKQLPNGVYYYVINVMQPICIGKISGSLTLIR